MDISTLLNTAIAQHAADIYLLPDGQQYRLSLYVAGQTQEFEQLTIDEAQTLTSAVKYEAQMNIAEKRRPQLGRFTFQYQDDVVWVRVSTVGDYQNRETLVMRLIYSAEQQHQNWLDSQQRQTLYEAIPMNGLFVFSGPTGSGKTTTMYDVLREKQAQQQLSVLTIEDPVEIQQPSFVQLQVNELAGMTYEELIKVALRHHPDVLLVGEIRDKQTADAAIASALSGHLVLSTLHAMSPRDVVTRLIDLGVDRRKLQLALSGVVYQRLLPMVTGGVGAVIDLWKSDDISRIFTQQAVDNFSFQWEEVLHAAYRKNIITQDTQDAFLALQTRTAS
jgi:competence protein ComGA